MTFAYEVDPLLRTKTAHCYCTNLSPQQIYLHFGMKPSIKLLHYTHPSIQTVIHVFQWKMHFQGHGMQCVTVVKRKMQLSTRATTPK